MMDSPVLGPGDPAPLTVLNPQGAAPLILTCEHAGKAFPAALGTLGVPPENLESHWVYDIGALEVARELSRLLDAPALCGTYSRLVVDLNRAPGDSDLFAAEGEGQPIPGNRDLTPRERQSRMSAIYEPYHEALAALVADKSAAGRVPAMISVHSFTPVFFGKPRPWEVGILWARDPRIPVPLLDFYRRNGVAVGDNAPYDARGFNGTAVNRHADSHGLPNVLIEFRHDTIRTPSSARDAAALCARGLQEIFSDPALFSRYGAHANPV